MVLTSRRSTTMRTQGEHNDQFDSRQRTSRLLSILRLPTRIQKNTDGKTVTLLHYRLGHSLIILEKATNKSNRDTANTSRCPCHPPRPHPSAHPRHPQCRRSRPRRRCGHAERHACTRRSSSSCRARNSCRACRASWYIRCKNSSAIGISEAVMLESTTEGEG